MEGTEFAVSLPRISMVLRMKKLILALTGMLAVLFSAKGQDGSYDVFIPITKYIEMGDADKLSAWFSNNLEVTIFSNSNDSSRKQAREILKSFFKSYTPRSFNITHKAGRSNMKYALGTLNAGGELFVVTIFVGYTDSAYKIQHIKIERIN